MLETKITTSYLSQSVLFIIIGAEKQFARSNWDKKPKILIFREIGRYGKKSADVSEIRTMDRYHRTFSKYF